MLGLIQGIYENEDLSFLGGCEEGDVIRNMFRSGHRNLADEGKQNMSPPNILL